MKKLLLILIVPLLLMGLSTLAFAADTYQLSDQKYAIANTSATTKVTYIPTTVIRDRGRDRVFKVTVNSILGAGLTHTEGIVAVYDCTSAAYLLASSMEGEIESNDSDSVSLEYKRPLTIYNGVAIAQGAFTTVLVEWEKVMP